MTHEYDDPVTEPIIERAVSLAIQMLAQGQIRDPGILAAKAVDTVFCTCVTVAADVSVRGVSPVHTGIIAEVERRVRLHIGIEPRTPRDAVDLASEQSFPASDPPAWIWSARDKTG